MFLLLAFQYLVGWGLINLAINMNLFRFMYIAAKPSLWENFSTLHPDVSGAGPLGGCIKNMKIPFRIPFNNKNKKRLANIVGEEIVEKVTDTHFIHTIPQSTIDAWNSKRRVKDKVNKFKDKPGFYIKKQGRTGTIYFVDDSFRMCECPYEISGSPEYDILLYTQDISGWFLPSAQSMTANEKNEVVSKMQSWLRLKKIRYC